MGGEESDMSLETVSITKTAKFVHWTEITKAVDNLIHNILQTSLMECYD